MSQDGRTLYDRGLQARRDVLGDEYVDAALGRGDGFDTEFQRFVVEYCWGVCWTDDRVPRRDRSLLNLGMTAALGRMEEFELHFKGALRNGMSEEELKAVLIQVAVYCGVPAGVSAFRIARKILAEESEATDAGTGNGRAGA
jgi:4-carboxymuconolactone decarboxylase